MIGGHLRPAGGGVATRAIVRGRHVAAGFVTERCKTGVVAAYARRGGFRVREGCPVALESLRRNEMAREAIETRRRGRMQAATAAMTARATAGHLIMVHQVRTPGAGAGMAGIAYRRQLDQDMAG